MSAAQAARAGVVGSARSLTHECAIALGCALARVLTSASARTAGAALTRKET